MSRSRPAKKPEPAPAPPAIRILPMELQVGDHLADETGVWEIIARPHSSSAGKIASARVRKIGHPDVTAIRTWSAHERISVKR